MGLYSVANGNPLKAADLNQYTNLFNGSVVGNWTISGGATTTNVPITFQIPNSNPNNGNIFSAYVTGDTGWARVWTYLDSNGNFNLNFNDGVNVGVYGTLTAQTGGWYVPQSFTAANNMVVNGAASSLAGLSVGGAMNVTGNTTLNGGSGTINVGAGSVAYSGSATVPVWPTASGGTGVWWTDDGTSLIGTTLKGANGNGRDFGLGYIDTGNAVHTMLSAQYGGAIWFAIHAYLQAGSLGGMQGGQFGGNGTQAISHGLGNTPDTVIACLGSTGNQQVWATTAVNGMGSSTFTFTDGASTGNNHYFIAFAN